MARIHVRGKKVFLLFLCIGCVLFTVYLETLHRVVPDSPTLDQSIDEEKEAYTPKKGSTEFVGKETPPVTSIVKTGICDDYKQNINLSMVIKKLNHVFVLDKQKLLFCYVPKVACTNWKRLLLVLQGTLDLKDKPSHMKVHQTADSSLKLLSGMKPADAERVLNNYTKIMFVRDPFARILSAYRDKLEKAGRLDSDRFRKNWSKTIRDRSNITRDKANNEKRDQYDVSFNEFASYLANPVNTLGRGDEEHWRPIYQLCQPCSIHYDFIGKFENLEHDTNYALTELIHSKMSIGLMNSTNFTNSSDIALIENYYSELSQKTLKGLYKRFQLDLELFQYLSPEHLFKRVIQKSFIATEIWGKENDAALNSNNSAWNI